jgi:hypothetical protein
LDFHTCDRRIEVTFNPWLDNIMMETCDLNDCSDTLFDLWMHSQVIHQQGSYNSV